MRKNKDVLVYQREKRRKLFLVGCYVRHGLGTVAGLAETVEKSGYTILSCFVSTPDSDGYSRCSFFIEANESRPSVDELMQVVGGSTGVMDVEVKGSHNGLIVDTLNFPLNWNSGDRAVMLRVQFFVSMEEGLVKAFKTGADVVLREMGYHHGRPTWENLLRTYPVRSKEDLVEAIGFYDANGWGRTEVVSFDFESKSAVVRLMDNFECIPKRAGENGSNFVRGHLEGLFSAILGDRTKVAETGCLCRGNPYCEFTVG